jgi:hypothetical protein
MPEHHARAPTQGRDACEDIRLEGTAENHIGSVTGYQLAQRHGRAGVEAIPDAVWYNATRNESVVGVVVGALTEYRMQGNSGRVAIVGKMQEGSGDTAGERQRTVEQKDAHQGRKGSFLKKRTKKLLSVPGFIRGSALSETPDALAKVFCFFFSKKKNPS